MTDRIEKQGLQVAQELAEFIENEALPGTGVEADAVWAGLQALVQVFGPRTAELVAKREELQGQLDEWHRQHKGQPVDAAAYDAFLTEIGYLEQEPPQGIQVAPSNIDSEIASLCGPQLVVPSTNLHMVMKAANARWGSLYDALYASDVLGSPAPRGDYDAARGAQVVAWAKAHLDKVVPLTKGSWADVVTMAPSGGKLMMIAGKGTTELADPNQFAGFNRDEKGNVSDVFLRANNLHIVLYIDRTHPIGKTDTAGIADIYLEAAVSTIVDLEDSVACVDAADKVVAYRNWLGLMKGDLTEALPGGDTLELNPDVGCEGPKGQPTLLKGRSLMLVRNVGLLMTTPAILDAEGNEVSEHLVDAMVTVLCAIHDLKRPDMPKNSPKGSIYIVKPKMHGPDEVAMCDRMFAAVEQALGLPLGTVKMGIMDEERRMSANLAAAIGKAPRRVCFINTGFLDRTGDEIHSCMEAGPMLRKADMQQSSWLQAYESRNVDAGLMCGLKGRAQIGKGMWTKPDRMADMMAAKMGHLEAGGTTAWVPSPRAAVLHACHYHERSVFQTLWDIAEQSQGKFRTPRATLLEVPVETANLSDDAVIAELENNCQGILGYVVRWVDQGVGCSKVPDINDVGLMEDRATLRISAQGLANWLHHGVVSEAQITSAMQKMAEVVDRQNMGDPSYRPMAPSFDGIAYKCALDLVLKGRVQPSGYTEPLLHAARAAVKARA